MTLKNVNYKDFIENVCRLVSAECHLSSVLKTAFGLLITLGMRSHRTLIKKIKEQ